MKICAAKDCRLAYFQQGQLVRWKYIDEKGLYDAKAKRHVEQFAEVDELDYYIRALKNSSAVLFEEQTQQMNKKQKFVKEDSDKKLSR